MLFVNKRKLVLAIGYLLVINSPAYAANVQTALGPIPADPEGLAGWVLKTSIGVAGGVAFLLMLYGGFLFLTSAGDPNKLQEATDVIMSALAGLLMIIFSVFLLRLIGYDILQIF